MKALSITLPLMLLCTGTSNAIIGQIINNMQISHPSAQIPTWLKYASTVIIATVLEGRKCWQVPQDRGILFRVVALGCLDVVAYSLYAIGFARCGSSLSMVVFAAGGQIFTAMMSRLVANRQLTARHLIAVSLVVAGLSMRAYTPSGANHTGGKSSGVGVTGLVMLVAAAFAYSVVGVLYEVTMRHGTGKLNAAQMTLQSSLVGLLLMSAYEVVYTLPRWQWLVTQPMLRNGVTTASALQMYGLISLISTAHIYVQRRLLEEQGALALSIVNALRSSTVSLASGALFCMPSAPQQCLTQATASSAACVTAGALVWASAGQPKLKTA